MADSTPLALAGTGSADIGLGLLAGNIGKPQYIAPGLSPTSSQTLTNQYGTASETPGEIAASQAGPAMTTGNQAASQIGGTISRQFGQMGISDPTNAISAINARVQRNVQGQLGMLGTNIQTQAQLQSADRLTKAMQEGIGNAQMNNSISMQRLQSYQNQLIARAQVISAITGGVTGAGTGAAMSATGKGKGSGSGGNASMSESGVYGGMGTYGANDLGGDVAEGATDLGSAASLGMA